MLLEHIWSALPGLQQAVVQQPLVQGRENVWVMLRQLLLAHAPSTGVTLPGAIFDQVTDIAAAFGLADRLDVSPAGNGGLWLGVAKERADLVVLAHLDRLSFRVRDLYDAQSAALFPMSMESLAPESVRSPAKALRYDAEQGRLQVTAQGQLENATGAEAPFLFRAEQGSIAWLDTVTLALTPAWQGDIVHGSGLDNCAGVLMALGAAAVLRQVEEALLEHNRRCLFVFHDRQGGAVGAPGGLSGPDSAVPSVLGTVIVDGQTGGHTAMLKHGAGVAYAYDIEGRGCHVPMNLQQFTQDLAAEFDRYMPAKAQHNRGAISRGEISLGAPGERVLGLMGPPLSCTHVGQERAALKDIQAGVWWLSTFLIAALNLVPAIAVRYALDR